MLFFFNEAKIGKKKKKNQPYCLHRILLCPQTPQRLARRGRPVQSVKNNPDEISESNIEAVPDAVAPLAEELEPVVNQPETLEEEGALQGDPGEVVEGEHACNECGMVFQRRYALIMHALKHEKARSFKCSVCILGLNKK